MKPTLERAPPAAPAAAGALDLTPPGEHRLVTYWLPVVPGWISFRVLERRGLI